MSELRMHPADILNCLDCGADLSQRGVLAKRCEKCQAARPGRRVVAAPPPVDEHLTKAWYHRPQRVPHSIWQKNFTLFGVEVRCHVLEDGQRIIEATSVEELFKEADWVMDDPGLSAFFDWLRGCDQA